ncbi:hypothetical protein OAN307_c17700 [Octadecabacter antarcticus 307]|uniref:Uncharacterized protein n=1 Tax=Octadecabacter antarcticus 307 TaxID=391626 RepID=M9RCB6_9RHOB|nr:hypothetical protein OAN307_c17700 [Octadecabacter antarcticus 307]
MGRCDAALALLTFVHAQHFLGFMVGQPTFLPFAAREKIECLHANDFLPPLRVTN